MYKAILKQEKQNARQYTGILLCRCVSKSVLHRVPVSKSSVDTSTNTNYVVDVRHKILYTVNSNSYKPAVHLTDT